MFRLHSHSGDGRRWRVSASIAAIGALFTIAAPAQAGQSAYVTNQNGYDVSQYDVDPSGLLAPLSPATVASGGAIPEGMAVSPDGQNAYVTNESGPGTVGQYAIGAGGKLSPMTPATVAVVDPVAVAVSPDSQNVYVAGSGDEKVYQFDVGTGGKLSPKTPATVAAGPSPTDVAVSADGQSVYVRNATSFFHNLATISQYDVGPGGALSPKDPPQVVVGANGPGSIAVSPDGQSLYVTNGNGDISQYDVGAGGKLSPKTPATVAAGSYPFGIAVTPDGHSVYVPDADDRDVSQYDVGAGGKLSPKTPATVAAGFAPLGVAVSLDGHNVYVANGGDDTVSQYDVGAGGRLSPKSPATVAAGDAPFWVAVNPPTNQPLQCRMNGGGTFPSTSPRNGRMLQKQDSLSSDMSTPVGPPNSGSPQSLDLKWGPSTDPTRHEFRLTTKLTLAQCVDTFDIDPGQGQKLDTMIAEGRGTVGGSPGFKIRLRLTDGGENESGSGVGKDKVRVKVTRVSDGRQVLQASGKLTAGNQDARDGV